MVGDTRLPRRGRRHTETAPDLSVVLLELEDALQVLDRLGKVLLGAQDAGDGIHGGNGPLIVAQSVLIGIRRPIEITHQLGQAPYGGVSEEDGASSITRS